MRTMKKVLSLSLVLAMALSMVAGAAYKDEATIKPDLAGDVNLLLALNVFTEMGTGEGNFEPTGEITRATAAKLIYVLKNKGVDDKAAAWSNLDLFKDVAAGHWAAGYVNYCAEAGIIAGTGDGFNPDAKIDGTQMAKLLLVLLGYKADLQGYTGNAWAANVRKDAQSAGIYNDYGLPITGIVTREWSAKLMVNGINAQKVRYDRGELLPMYDSNNSAITYASQDLGLKYHTGTLLATPTIKLPTTAGVITAGTAAVSTTSKTSTVSSGTATADMTFVADAGLLGQPVKVLYKETTGGVVGLDAMDKIYGVVADTAGKSYNITRGEVAVDTTKLTVPGLDKKDYTGKSILYVDGLTVSSKSANTPTDVSSMFYNSTDKITLVDNNNDGFIDMAVAMNKVVYGIVASHDAAKSGITFKDATGAAINVKDEANTNVIFNNSEAGKKNYAALVFADTVAKDDVVAIKTSYASGKAVHTIAKIAAVTGKLENVASSSITVAGTVYKMAGDKVVGYTALPTAEKYGSDISIYAVGNFVIYSTEAGSTTAENPTNLAMVIASEPGKAATGFNPKTPTRVQIITEDGKTAIYDYVAPGKNININGKSSIDLGEANGAQVNTNINNDEVYFYAFVGGKLVLQTIENATDIGNTFVSAQAATTQVFNKSAMTLTADNITFAVTEKSIFFVKEAVAGKDVKYAVIKGTEMPGDATGMTGKDYAANLKGIRTIVYSTMVTSSTITAAAVEDFVYSAGASSVTGRTDAGDYIVTTKFLDNKGEEKIITTHEATATVPVYKNNLYKAVTNAAGVTTLTEITTSALGDKWVLAASGGSTETQLLAKPNGGVDTFYKITADTKIFYVDTNTQTNSTTNVFSSGFTGVPTAVASANNVLFQLKTGSTTELAYVFVEVNGAVIADANGIVSTMYTPVA